RPAATGGPREGGGGPGVRSRSLESAIPAWWRAGVLLALPAAAGQAGPIHPIVEDAVLRRGRCRSRLLHALAVVANELFLAGAGLAPVELPAAGETDGRQRRADHDAHDARRA